MIQYNNSDISEYMFICLQNPYPTDIEKLQLIKLTNLTLVQVENWFINARRRVLQRMLTKSQKFKAKCLKLEGMYVLSFVSESPASLIHFADLSSEEEWMLESCTDT